MHEFAARRPSFLGTLCQGAGNYLAFPTRQAHEVWGPVEVTVEDLADRAGEGEPPGAELIVSHGQCILVGVRRDLPGTSRRDVMG